MSLDFTRYYQRHKEDDEGLSVRSKWAWTHSLIQPHSGSHRVKINAQDNLDWSPAVSGERVVDLSQLLPMVVRYVSLLIEEDQVEYTSFTPKLNQRFHSRSPGHFVCRRQLAVTRFVTTPDHPYSSFTLKAVGFSFHVVGPSGYGICLFHHFHAWSMSHN